MEEPLDFIPVDVAVNQILGKSADNKFPPSHTEAKAIHQHYVQGNTISRKTRPKRRIPRTITSPTALKLP